MGPSSRPPWGQRVLTVCKLPAALSEGKAALQWRHWGLHQPVRELIASPPSRTSSRTRPYKIHTVEHAQPKCRGIVRAGVTPIHFIGLPLSQPTDPSSSESGPLTGRFQARIFFPPANLEMSGIALENFCRQSRGSTMSYSPVPKVLRRIVIMICLTAALGRNV